MKIKQITETTTAGSIATVNSPIGGTQSRGNPSIYGGKKVGSLFKGKKTSAPYANSVNESAEISEAHLEEDDIIVVPGQGRSRKSGFVKHDPDRAENEGQTLKNSLHTIVRVASHLDKELSVRDNFPEWVSEKIGSVKGDMVAVMDYLISSKEMQGVTEGSQRGDTLVTDALKIMRGPEVNDAILALKTVLGNREYNSRRGFYNFYVRQILDTYGQQGVAEGKRNLKCVCKTHGTMQCPVHTPKDIEVIEGAKVDRMVKHVAQSEKKLGHSKKEAENIAWATANKRGMLDNKNKKA
jgi:hypothetical protein